MLLQKREGRKKRDVRATVDARWTTGLEEFEIEGKSERPRDVIHAEGR